MRGGRGDGFAGRPVDHESGEAPPSGSRRPPSPRVPGSNASPGPTPLFSRKAEWEDQQKHAGADGKGHAGTGVGRKENFAKERLGPASRGELGKGHGSGIPRLAARKHKGHGVRDPYGPGKRGEDLQRDEMKAAGYATSDDGGYKTDGTGGRGSGTQYRGGRRPLREVARSGMGELRRRVLSPAAQAEVAEAERRADEFRFCQELYGDFLPVEDIPKKIEIEKPLLKDNLDRPTRFDFFGTAQRDGNGFIIADTEDPERRYFRSILDFTIPWPEAPEEKVNRHLPLADHDSDHTFKVLDEILNMMCTHCWSVDGSDECC